MSRYFGAAWLLLVLTFMTIFAKPLHKWGIAEIGSAIFTFILLGFGGIGLVHLLHWAVSEFAGGFRKGIRDAWTERELNEAELET